ncbi:MAG TPA: SDR family NAD(P)-dependent oxidoreductase [Dehalococcoidales bacterium]|nr:SDR family NAD(P)-dependent oxidoreductase [Dehalococcoidales bacterium]
MGNLLKGRVAVVTGAGNGIGRAEAIELASQGASVVVNDIGTSPDGTGFSRGPADAVVNQIVTAGGSAVASYESVTSEKGAETIIRTAMASYGRLDVLVNNAGVVKDPQDISEIKTEDWEIQIKTHLFGTFYCTRAASGVMKKQGYGRIINTASHTGLGWKGFAPYSAAKEGIIGFTRTVARDVAEFGVTCNAIRPVAAWRGTKENIPRVAVNRPEDVAALVVYLASEEAGDINGCIFEVWRGHVGIFVEPPPVQQVIRKDGSWTPEELAKTLPQSLTRGRSRTQFPNILNLD